MANHNQTGLFQAFRPQSAAFRAALAAICVFQTGGCLSDAQHANDMPRDAESELVGWEGSKDQAPDPRDIAEGRRIAQRECSACHAIDQASASSHPGAPPFRDILFLNDPEWVAYRLIDAVRMGHDNMPLFDFDVRSADQLIAYIKSIGAAPDGAKP